MKSRYRCFPPQSFCLGLVLAGIVVVSPIFGRSATPRLPSAIDAGQIFSLPGNTRPAVASGRAQDQGEVPGSQVLPRISLQFALTVAQQSDLEQLLAAQQDRHSSQYHKFLTPEEFGSRFGLNTADLSKITDWLQAQGFANIQVARGRTWVSCSGTAAQVRAAFHTSIHKYILNGEAYFANSSDPQLPKALEGIAQSIRGLHNFRLKPHIRILPRFTSSISGNHYTAPDDWETIYNVKPIAAHGVDGTGITIAVVGQSSILLSDIAAFRSAANLAAKAPTVLVPPGHTAPGFVSGDEEESDLDLEWSGAIAPNANILFITASATVGNGVDDSITYAIDNNVAPIMSTSYGLCEPDVGSAQVQSQNLLFQQANAQGMTVVAAAGDEGADDCSTNGVPNLGYAVDYPASSPNVTGIGGTSFNEGSGTYWGSTNNNNSGSALSYIPEQVWNDGSDVAGGGGASIYATKPSWQNGTGVPNDNARDVPDLAFDASPGHDGLLYCNEGWCTNGFRNSGTYLDVIGGTSAGAPSFAGVLALLVQQNGGTRLGNINPRLYALAASSSDAFHDVTVGNNIVACQVGTATCPASGTVGFNAGIGYDQASGWGSINATNFILELTGTSIPQTISFPAISAQSAGTTITLSASATSGLAVSFSSSTPAVCTISGNSASLIAAGNCTVIASQAGSSNYSAAPSVTQSFAVALASQTISYPTLTAGKAGTFIPILATATSSLPVQYSVSPANVCNGVPGGNSELITYVGPGVCVITFSQPGNNAYLAAPSVSDFVQVSPAGSLTSVQFVPVTPCRVVDTRLANGAFGGPELPAGSTRNFVIPSGACNIPAGATAYSLNVTVVPAAGLGFLSIWPSGETQPNVSTLNSDSRTKANAAIVPAGSNGAVSVYVSDTTHVILDINGYFTPASASNNLDFYPLTPCRIADTRNPNGALGGPYLAGGVARSFPVLSSSCGLSTTAQAYSLNFTVVPHTPLGYLSTWPAGQPQPVVSTLNAFTQAITANAAIVPAGTNGAIDVYASNDTDVIIDMNGYFAPPALGGLTFYTVTPCRVLDTRSGSGLLNGTLNVNVAGSACAPPATAQAFVLNATIVPPSLLGFLTLWPNGVSQPLVSTLNAFDGVITSNMAIVPTSDGTVNAYTTNPTQLILDISAYFAP